MSLRTFCRLTLRTFYLWSIIIAMTLNCLSGKFELAGLIGLFAMPLSFLIPAPYRTGSAVYPWVTLDEARPKPGETVLCWGRATPLWDEPGQYLAWADEEGAWFCDVTGQRVIAPQAWTFTGEPT